MHEDNDRSAQDDDPTQDDAAATAELVTPAAEVDAPVADTDTDTAAATEPEPATTAIPAAGGRPAHAHSTGRVAAIGAAAGVAVIGVFLLGLAIGTHHDGGDEHGQRGSFVMHHRGGPGQDGSAPGMRGDQNGPGGGSGPMGGGPDSPYGRDGGGGMGGGMRGGRGGGMGGGMGGGGMGGGNDRMHGGGDGGMRGGRGGGIGVVEKIKGDTLTVASLGGPADTIKVTLGDDTKILQRGNDGPMDVEDAEASDIDEGDVVMIHASRKGSDTSDESSQGDTTKIAADAVIILHAADE